MKLVRDKIPDIIRSSGQECRYFKVNSRSQHMEFLREKMVEELEEFMENPCEEEAGDMLEVFFTMIKIMGISFEDVQDVSYVKKLERGGFEGGIILSSWGE